MSEEVSDLLTVWEDAWLAGNDIPAERLCADRPDLLAEVKEGIVSLKQTA